MPYSQTSSPHSFFFINSSFMADSTGPAECCETSIVTDRTPTSLISNRRRHQLQQSVMENLCFVRKLTPMLLKENECSSQHFIITPWCHQWAGCRRPLGNGQRTLLPHSWCLHQSEKCQTWKQIGVRGNSILSQASLLTVNALAYARHKWKKKI